MKPHSIEPVLGGQTLDPALLTRIIDILPDPVFVKDRHHRWVFVNRAFCEVFGLTADELIGKPDAAFFPPEQTVRFWESDGVTLARGYSDKLEIELPDSNGELRTVMTKKVRFDLTPEQPLIIGVIRDITDIKRSAQKIKESEAHYRNLFREMHVAMLKYDFSAIKSLLDGGPHLIGPHGDFTPLLANATILDANATALALYRAPDKAALFQALRAGSVGVGEERVGEELRALVGGDSVYQADTYITDFTGQKRPVHFQLSVPLAHRNDWSQVFVTLIDISARLQAEEERRHMEIQLRHAQKLESIGQLAAGIAHEINTPTQFVGDNLSFLAESFTELIELMVQQQQLVASVSELALRPELKQLASAVKERAEAIDSDYLQAEIPEAIKQSLEGIQRISGIVRAMKEFSHPGGEAKTPVDLNRAIVSTTTVSRNEWKYVADLVLTLDERLPAVPCIVGDINQVILNLVVNAAHAIATKQHSREEGESSKGTITVTTRYAPPWAEMVVADTGTGIPAAIHSRIFDPFFTTKAVGKGTGQGLSIAYATVVEKHGGEIFFATEEGVGTTFTVRLPLEGVAPSRCEAQP